MDGRKTEDDAGMITDRGSGRIERRAAEQPDAADEVGALRERLAPPSQLIRVFYGPRGG
jgi:hypothetical protein